MRRYALLLGCAVFIAACTEEVPVSRPHDFAAEVSSSVEYEDVEIVVGADYSVNCSVVGMTAEPVLDCTVHSLGALRIVTGECRNIAELVEESFWKETSAQWIYCLTLDSRSPELESMGFADCFRHFLSEEAGSGRFMYAASNFFDRLDGLVRQDGGVSFNVRLKVEQSSK